jgi:hypothetical protein
MVAPASALVTVTVSVAEDGVMIESGAAVSDGIVI